MVRDIMKRIDIAKDFSDTPIGRYHPDDGPFTGERFREEFLYPALKKEGQITVAIDATEGYGSSFLDEAFGGLVRKGYFTAKQLSVALQIENIDPDFAIYRDLIWKYIKAGESK